MIMIESLFHLYTFYYNLQIVSPESDLELDNELTESITKTDNKHLQWMLARKRLVTANNDNNYSN